MWYLLAKDEGRGFAKKRNQDFLFYATVLFIKQYLLNWVIRDLSNGSQKGDRQDAKNAKVGGGTIHSPRRHGGTEAGLTCLTAWQSEAS